jgi:hypothetical protein
MHCRSGRSPACMATAALLTTDTHLQPLTVRQRLHPPALSCAALLCWGLIQGVSKAHKLRSTNSQQQQHTGLQRVPLC